MTPTIGRIVHVYRRDTMTPVPAIVTHVHYDGLISVVAFSAFGDDPVEASKSIKHADQKPEIWWDWPPRE